MKKRLLLLPIFAGMVLSGCDFSLESLKFWEKKTEVADQGGTNTPSNGDNNGSNGGNENGGNQNGGNENGGNNNGGNNNGGNENGGQTDSSTVKFDFSSLAATEGSSGGVSFTTSKENGQSAPAYNSNSLELRLYANNSITFTSSNAMTSIKFDANTCNHDKTDGQFSASAGSLNGFTWSGSAKSVTFTVSSGKQVHINSITVSTGEGGGSSQGGGGETSSLTIDDICSEISYNLFEEEGNEFELSQGSYFLAVNWGASSSTTLLKAVQEAVEYLPDALEEVQEPVEDTWQDGSDGAFAVYCDASETIFVEIGSYVDSTNIAVQFCVYSDDDEGGSSSSGSGGESESSLDSICTEICYNISGSATNAFQEDDGDYYLSVTWGTTSQYTLLSAVEDAAKYLPSGFVELEAPAEDTWQDGDDGAFATYCDSSYTYIIEIGSYVSGSNVVVQFLVYEY